MSEVYQKISCPRCGTDDPIHEYDLNISSIVSCSNCALRYLNPRISHEALERKVQSWAEQDVIDDERLAMSFNQASLDYFGRFVGSLSKFVKPGSKRLLDIGCSTGALMKVAQRDGWNPEGLELGRASAQYVKQTLGFPVHLLSIYEFEPGEGIYDAISFVEVIEHLEYPDKALKKIHGWLKPEGLLLITTPNFDSLYRRLFGERWWVINCEDEHIIFYNLKTLVNHLEENGFQILEKRIQGLDVLGMLRQWKKPKSSVFLEEKAVQQNGYYEARESKVRLKSFLDKMKLLKLVKYIYHCLENAYISRWSPFYGFGEQLVVLARKKS